MRKAGSSTPKGDCVVWCEKCQRGTPARTVLKPRQQHFYGCRGVPSDWRWVRWRPWPTRCWWALSPTCLSSGRASTPFLISQTPFPTIALPIDTAKALEEVQQALAIAHGIEFSKSQVIAYLCHYHRKREQAAQQAAQAEHQTDEPG